MVIAKRFYDSNQTDYTTIDHRLSEVLSQAVRCSPTVIVDIGCGRGSLMLELARRLPQARLVGVDISAKSVAFARRAGLEVLEEDISYGTSLATNFADLIIFGEVIEHVFDPDQCLEEIYRVLRPGGSLIITTPNLASWANRLLLFLGIQPLFTETSTRKKYGRAFRILGNGRTQVEGHIRLFTAGALVEMLFDTGFTCELVRGVRFMGFENNLLLRLIDNACRFRPTLASGLLVVARR